ncbi:hypothetical protein H9I45_15055 [Polaribacter haliotis]|uniref:Uncharacterized protein n=1 Tax=Polaribacter haliotis TaxID=1888915 RepID=A0A7L8AF99_9FLAO|nr:hypothetical protein [Polaribacter haliotis]QOD60637.1 hypothetical protein H9I45_15055 [Polaribacter haliotis]
MDIVKDLNKLIDDCTENEIDFKDLYYELISLREKYSKQLTIPVVGKSFYCVDNDKSDGLVESCENQCTGCYVYIKGFKQ